MRAVVIQEPVIQPDITPAELTQHWRRLETLPGMDEVKILTPPQYPSLEELDDIFDDYDAVFGVWIGPDIINEPFLSLHRRLKYIATLGHGWETFDPEVTRRHHVLISNTIYGTQTIAEYAFALLMAVCHQVSANAARLRETDWTDPRNAPEYCRAVTPQIELYGKTAGIYGLGAIGYAFARMLQGFGTKVIAYSRHKKQGPEYDWIEQVDTPDELFGRSDIISLHVPHTPATEHLINADTIAQMKDGVILINTARGALIDEPALAAALRTGKVRAAGLDVLTEEPPVHGSPLLDAPNAVITPHIAWLTRESRFRAIDMAIDQFASYLHGSPVSIIS